jgi:hypothetical protein
VIASIISRRLALAALTLTLLVVLAGTAQAQPKADIVRLANGDHITGEVKNLNRGQLELSTDDVGTLYFEWDKIVSLSAVGQFDVTTTDGRRFLGGLAAGDPKTLVIVEVATRVPLPMIEVATIAPIGASFWKKLDGSIDVGYSYTRSSQISQLNVNSDTLFRRPAFEARLDASATLTQNGDDGERDDRATIQASYVRYRGPRLFIASATGFESNESLGLLLRSQVALALGARLVNDNRAQLAVSSGISVNDERSVDADPTQNIEALVTIRESYYRYDRPKTNVDIGFQYYASLNNWGRQRIQLDTGAKREVLKDLFLAINVFDTFDSRPPSPDAAKNDVGVSFSIGWSY